MICRSSSTFWDASVLTGGGNWAGSEYWHAFRYQYPTHRSALAPET